MSVFLDVLRAIIPPIGIAITDVKNRRFSSVVDELVSHIAGALTAINQELVAMRAMVMQNRLALDIILVKEGSVCQVIKVRECCTYIPDYNKIIQTYINNITNLTNSLHELKETGFWEIVGS